MFHDIVPDILKILTYCYSENNYFLRKFIWTFNIFCASLLDIFSQFQSSVCYKFILVHSKSSSIYFMNVKNEFQKCLITNDKTVAVFFR